MVWTRNAWNNFKAQPEIWFFYAFILTSPFSIRKIFFYFPLFGEFNEYTGSYLYLSDIFFGLTLGTWIISILYNKYCKSSNYSSRLVSRGTIISFFVLPALLVLWSFITILWSRQAEIAAYRSFKLFEFYLLYLFLVLNPRCATMVKMFHVEHLKKLGPNFLRNIFHLIILIGLINATIGILQVILQHSVGLFWLKESLIDPELPGVAKIILNRSKYIRAYGLFPHPNILGGFLFLSITLTLAYRQLFHVEQLPPSCVAKWTKWKDGLCKIYSTPTTFLPNPDRPAWNMFSYARRHIITFVLIIQIVAGILTFSKSAILGLILALTYLMIWHGKVKMFHMEHSNFLRGVTLKKALLMAVIVGLGIYLIHPDFGSIFIKSMVERLVYIKISLNIISGNFLAGIGLGQFILEMQKYSSQAILPWQFQPVHNVFLLIWSELGLIGFSIFVWFNWKLFHLKRNVSRLPRESQMFHVEHLSSLRGGKTRFQMDISTVLKALLMGFFVIALFDHYLWDIQQGQIMLWITLGLLARIRLNP